MKAGRPGLNDENRRTELSEGPGGVILAVRVQPRAGRPRVERSADGTIVVRVTAPPVEGRANRACLETVAEWLGVRKSQVTLVSGQAARRKLVLVTGVDPKIVRRAVESL